MDLVALDRKWLAGFFDGEGCITTSRRGEVPNAIRVTIHGNFPETLRRIKEEFGGHLKLESEKTGHWYSASNMALKFLEAIAEHTDVKKEEVALGIEFQRDMVNLNRCASEQARRMEILRRERIRKELARLNRMRNIGKQVD
jgi:hypothetical protein